MTSHYNHAYVDAHIAFDYARELYFEKLKELHKKSVEITERFSKINWMLGNPWTQWTSSFNPLDITPAKWYGENYTPFIIGFPELENTLRLCLARLGLHRDIRGLIVREYLFNVCISILFE